MAALAVLGIIRRLYGVGGDEVGPVAPGHVLPPAGYTPLQIRLNGAPFVAVEAEGLHVAIGAIIARPLRQQTVLLDKKRTMIVHQAESAMAVPTFLRFGVLIFPVVCLGERETDDYEEKGGGQQYYFRSPMIQHSFPSQVQ
jgi:hypothetical protein